MTLENLQQALKENNLELIRRLGNTNKDVLDKFSVDEDGNVLYNGEKIISDIQISAAAGNAIKQKEDGIHVEDLSEDLKNVSDKVDSFKRYQKYKNIELNYCFCRNDNQFTPHVGEIIPLTKKSGNIEVVDSKIIIYPHQTLQFNIEIAHNDARGKFTWNLKDITNDTVIDDAYITIMHENSTSAATFPSSFSCQYTNKTDKDCELAWICTGIAANYGVVYKNGVSLSVQEIGREIVIDPVEYVNDQQGIEDTPVGHILSYMGNTPPKHYLNCDGTEYDIIDYPYLAEHIREQFGSYDYFGGDGVNTFAVPDLRGEFLRDTGTAERNTGSGAEVGEHQDATIHSAFYYDELFCRWPRSAYSRKPEEYNSDTQDISSRNFTHAGGSLSNNSIVTDLGDYTSRPTNTSVMYCIKYEPTYYFEHNEIVTRIGRKEKNLLDSPVFVPLKQWDDKYNYLCDLNDSIENYDEIIIQLNHTYLSDQNIPIQVSLIKDTYTYSHHSIQWNHYTEFVSFELTFINDRQLGYYRLNHNKESKYWDDAYITHIYGIKYEKLTEYSEDEIQQAVLETIDELNKKEV